MELVWHIGRKPSILFCSCIYVCIFICFYICTLFVFVFVHIDVFVCVFKYSGQRWDGTGVTYWTETINSFLHLSICVYSYLFLYLYICLYLYLYTLLYLYLYLSILGSVEMELVWHIGRKPSIPCHWLWHLFLRIDQAGFQTILQHLEGRQTVIHALSHQQTCLVPNAKT